MRQKNVLIAALLVLLIFAACASKFDKRKFVKVNQAARAVKSSISSGVSYEQLDELLKKLSAEISALENTVQSGEEKELLRDYAELLSIYQDGYLLWKYKLEFVRYGFVPKGLIYVGQDVEPIVEKYRLPTETHVYSHTRQTWKSIAESSIQIIWANANSKLEIINRILNQG